MDITSHHLDVVRLSQDDGEGEAGEELTKRGENFGHPVGKGASVEMPLHRVSL
jgi:DNA-directed RNA polymerase II subunit RPB3